MSCVRTAIMAQQPVTTTTTTTTTTLSARQRLALTKSAIDPASALAMSDSEIDALFLKRCRIPTSQIRASRITPLELKQRGIESSMGLRELGFDAIDLTEAGFCASAVSAFGADDVKRHFLLDAGDAVAVAGSVAVFQLGLTTGRLLELCAGAPTQAKAVLQQSEPRGGALQQTSPTTLLDTGLRANTLCELGYYANNVRDQTNATTEQLRLLGFV